MNNTAMDMEKINPFKQLSVSFGNVAETLAGLAMITAVVIDQTKYDGEIGAQFLRDAGVPPALAEAYDGMGSVVWDTFAPIAEAAGTRAGSIEPEKTAPNSP